MQADLVIRNVQLATMDPGLSAPYGSIENAVVGIRNGKIIWAGNQPDSNIEADDSLDGEGGWLTPGLIDCHTHLVYGGNRATEWEARLEGISYEEIARGGGGIISTVKATREASFDELLSAAQKRLTVLQREGVTSIEIKSGYGLEINSERKMLAVARKLEEDNPMTVSKTFLGAHTVPPEYQGKADDYVDYIVDEMLPVLVEEELVDAVDVFCEGIGFTRAQCERVFETANNLGIRVKGHVEQLSNLSGASLVAEFDGLSADHLEYLENDDIEMLREHEVVAVLLPGAFYFLGETRHPPVQALREAGVRMALATDLNPGSSPICSLLFTLNLGCVQLGLTPEEALVGVTRNAAKALGLEGSKGVIKEGYDADLVLWDIGHPAELSYGVNMNKPVKIWKAGRYV